MAQRSLTVAGVKALRALNVRRLHSDAACRGLYLKTTASGTASWIFRWRDRDTGKLRDMGLGSTGELSLADARDEVAILRKAIREGADPIAERRQRRLERRAQSLAMLTFDECVSAYIDAKDSEWRNPKHRQQWVNTLATYASPVIGQLPVNQIQLAHVVNLLKPIWTTKTETAKRLRGRVEAVLAWATVSGYREGDNPARWKGNLDQVLPKPGKVAQVTHHPALPWQEIGSFMAELRARAGMGARALEFAILTAARSGEVREATWDEIDLEQNVWRIPATRMKSGKAHMVPLSKAAVRILKDRPKSDSPHLFPNAKGGPLSDMTISAVTRRMGVNAVPHGFRSTFKDWARSSTGYPDEASELALAHVSSDSTRAAYARDELLPIRTRLMNDWAKFVDTPIRKAKVTAIRPTTDTA